MKPSGTSKETFGPCTGWNSLPSASRREREQKAHMRSSNKISSATNDHVQRTSPSPEKVAVAGCSSSTLKYVLLAGFLLRLLLFTGLPDSALLNFSERVELVTPLTSFKRLTEGLYLLRNGVPPYDGDMIHQPPLLVALFHVLHRFKSSLVVPLVYTLIDVMIAFHLYAIAEFKLRSCSTRPKLDLRCENQHPIREAVIIPEIVSALYLFNPMTVLTCLSKNTMVFGSLAVVLGIRYACNGSRLSSMFWIAMASYLTFYPIMLVVPAAMLLQGGTSPYSVRSSVTCVTMFAVCLGGLLSVSYLLVGSWQFLSKTTGVIIYATDLTPNIGLYWYFFIEMFDQFRSFFIVVFQLYAFAFMGPITLKYPKDPLFVATLLLGIISAFKSYPTLGDTALFLAFLPIWYEIFKYLRYGYVVTSIYMYTAVLSPVFWYLWIYQGSGNANFFYAITLVYGTGQIILIVDAAFAFLRRQWDITEGVGGGRHVLIRQL